MRYLLGSILRRSFSGGPSKCLSNFSQTTVVTAVFGPRRPTDGSLHTMADLLCGGRCHRADTVFTIEISRQSLKTGQVALLLHQVFWKAVSHWPSVWLQSTDIHVCPILRSRGTVHERRRPLAAMKWCRLWSSLWRHCARRRCPMPILCDYASPPKWQIVFIVDSKSSIIFITFTIKSWVLTITFLKAKYSTRLLIFLMSTHNSVACS